MTSFNFTWKSDRTQPKSILLAKKRKASNEKIDLPKKLPKRSEIEINKKNKKIGKVDLTKSNVNKPESSNKDDTVLSKKRKALNEENDVPKKLAKTFEFEVIKKNKKSKLDVSKPKTFNKSNSLKSNNLESTQNSLEGNLNSNKISSVPSFNNSSKLIKRKWKKDKLAAKSGGEQNVSPIKLQHNSLFKVGKKPIYVKGNSRGKSAVEEVFSVDKQFSDLNIHKYIVSNLEKNNFKTLTNVQEKSIPLILEGQNVLVRSQTGSGKTLAYATPILDSLQSIDPKLQRSDGVQAIIVVPTRELALQTQELFKKINTFQWIVVSNLCGGENRNSEKTRLRKGVHILVATPGRLLDHILHTNAFRTENVRCLILDEADRLLDMGFKKDIVRIVEELDNSRKNAEYNPMALLKNKNFIDNKNDISGDTTASSSTSRDGMPLRNVRSKIRQTVLLSATLTKGIAELADFTMKEHIYVDALDEFMTQHPELMVIPNTVEQKFIVTHVKHRLFTLSALVLYMSKSNSKVFIFMGTSSMVDYHYELFTRFLVRLRKRIKSTQVINIEEDSDGDEEVVIDMDFFKLHGNMDQSARKDVFNRFRAGKRGILLCTDVVARGIDVPTADCIVQYNGPQSIEDYIHRVGRTGRAGKSGSSYIFLTHEEQDFVTEMEKHRVYLQKQDTSIYLQYLSNVMEEMDNEQAATVLQKHYARALEQDKELHRLACNAYASWSRFYNTYSSKMRSIFDFKEANLGHYVTSFGLQETPTAVARIVKGHFVKKEAPRLNKKLANHEENAPLVRPPKKKKIKSVSLTTSEFSSGLEPAKKKKKKHLENARN